MVLAKTTQMDNTIKSMSKQIQLLEEKIKSNNNEQFSCEVCEYKAKEKWKFYTRKSKKFNLQ